MKIKKKIIITNITIIVYIGFGFDFLKLISVLCFYCFYNYYFLSYIIMITQIYILIYVENINIVINVKTIYIKI